LVLVDFFVVGLAAAGLTGAAGAAGVVSVVVGATTEVIGAGVEIMLVTGAGAVG